MLLQEELLAQDPSGFRMVVGCILLNQTARSQAEPVAEELFREYPRAVELATAMPSRLADVLKPIGLQNRRAALLKKFALWWLERNNLTRAEGMRMMEPPGVGEYARDSWLIFMDKRNIPAKDVNDKELKRHLEKKMMEKLWPTK